MKKTLLALAVFGSASLYAQTTFQRSFGSPSPSLGYNIIQNADSTYVVAGTTNGGANADIYLVKTNRIGNVVWARSYGGMYYDAANCIKPTADGGYIVCGNTNSFGQGTYVDAFLMKIDATGNITWSKTYGATYGDYFQSVVQAPDGGYLAAGHATMITSSALNDIYLVRTNSIGDTLWTKTYSCGDACNSISPTSDGGFIITGITANNGVDIFLLKIDSVGTTQWAKAYGGSNQESSGNVQQTSDGGYIFSGATMSFGAGSNDGLLVKCDSLGNFLWAKTYGGVMDDGFTNTTEVQTGGYAIAGYTRSVVPDASYIIRTDANGDTLWMNAYSDGNATRGNWVIGTSDHGFALTGNINDPNFSYSFMYMVKTDSLGRTAHCNFYPIVLSISSPTLSVANLPVSNAHGGIVGTPSATSSPDVSVTELCFTTQVNAFTEKQNSNFYPNPFNTSTQIAIEQTGELSIYNVLGEMVLSIPVNAPSVTIDKGMLQNGMYIWVMKSEGKILSTGKLIAQ